MNLFDPKGMLPEKTVHKNTGFRINSLQSTFEKTLCTYQRWP
jgi:hypothetical protein